MKNRMILCLGILLILVMASADSYAADGPRKKRKKHAADTVLVIVRDTVQMTDTMYVPYDFMEKTCPEVVRPGIEVLEMMDFGPLKGKRVGLVTNPSGVDRNLRSTIDILYNADGVELVALFGPEHGVRGDVYAGGKVYDVVDKTTGLPVYSLYGATRKPTPEMLEGIDVMVYDIQDVGARSYTFISTLGLVMEACSELDIEVMVLDRPNPLGGLKVEGCVAEDGLISFVGQYKIPYIYGLTVGVLAGLEVRTDWRSGAFALQPDRDSDDRLDQGHAVCGHRSSVAAPFSEYPYCRVCDKLFCSRNLWRTLQLSQYRDRIHIAFRCIRCDMDRRRGSESRARQLLPAWS